MDSYRDLLYKVASLSLELLYVWTGYLSVIHILMWFDVAHVSVWSIYTRI